MTKVEALKPAESGVDKKACEGSQDAESRRATEGAGTCASQSDSSKSALHELIKTASTTAVVDGLIGDVMTSHPGV